MTMVKVKICGLDSPDTCKYLDGADWAGVIVCSPFSKRNKDLNIAREIIDALPTGTKSVAVTVTSSKKDLDMITRKLEPEVIQLHSRDSQATWINDLATEYPSQKIALVWSPSKDHQIGTPESIMKRVEFVVLDSTDARGYGGTGRLLNWVTVAQFMKTVTFQPILLAGGLTPQNVVEAIKTVKPDGVDVSSGVEKNGKKDPYLIKQFLKNAKGV